MANYLILYHKTLCAFKNCGNNLGFTGLILKLIINIPGYLTITLRMGIIKFPYIIRDPHKDGFDISK